MIIAEVAGGLANQMIIYAAARALAIHKNVELKLDLSALNKDKTYKYYLHNLNISAELASPDEIAKIRQSSKMKIVEKIKNKLRKKLKIKVPYIYREPLCSYDDSFWSLPDDVYIGGNFISTKYFDKINDILIKEFAVKTALSSKTEEVCETIKNCESVSIHVRRGDFASNPHTNEFHGLVDVDYYSRAIKYIESHVPNPSYFLFSDNLEWARENIKSEQPIIFVDHVRQDDAYEDMHLMKHCKHNILANSGFGLFGARLNENSQKIVIAPKKWFANEEMNALLDLIPKEWIRL